jgi:AcrR family transcriptional regulator
MIAADLHGEPIARIAAEVGITRPTVYSWLGKA